MKKTAMVKRVGLAVVVVSVAVFGGRTVGAAPLIVVGGPGGSLKPVGTATGDPVGNGHWDSLSYDSGPTQSPGMCTASAFVGGAGCNWALPPHDLLSLPTAYIADPNLPINYLAGHVAAGELDTPLNFHFLGDFLFDIAALAQVTAWDQHLEFGWYEAGNPANRTALLSGGPFVNNTAGGPNVEGTAKVLLTGAYGFYYKNTQFAEGNPDRATIFYTESMFNQMGNYFSYFDAPEFNGRQLPQTLEGDFGAKIHSFQQFMLLNQGNMFWLGLEDQFGKMSLTFCSNSSTEDELAMVQPCSDYDHNDLIVAMNTSSVPEPTTLTILALGLFGAAIALKRRTREL